MLNADRASAVDLLKCMFFKFKFKFILFSSHIKQLTNTKNKFTLMKVNGDVDAIKERKACD